MKQDGYEEIDLLDYLNVVIKRRRMIFRNVFFAMLLVGLISLLIPSAYLAVTTILPPEDNPSAGILTTLSDTPLSNFLLTQTSSSSELFVEILKSRSVLDGVLLEKFDYPKNEKNKTSKTLLQIYHLSSLEKGRKKLLKKIAVESSTEGIIQLRFEAHDPELAADVANAFVAQLDKINKEKSTSRAKNSRIYIENQLKITEEKLAVVAKQLAEFQAKYKAVSLETQTETAIQEAGELKGRIIAKEVELGVALQSFKPDHIIVIKLKKELEELKKHYENLQYGNGETLPDQKEFYIPFADVPGVGLELARLMRDLKVQETVWELLNQQYYQAKIQEARDTPTIQVLDEAVPPEMRSKPKRKTLILISGFLALLFSIFWAYAVEFFENLKQNASAFKKTLTMIEQLKTDFYLIKSYLRKIATFSKGKQ